MKLKAVPGADAFEMTAAFPVPEALQRANLEPRAPALKEIPGVYPVQPAAKAILAVRARRDPDLWREAVAFTDRFDSHEQRFLQAAQANS